MSGHQGLGGVRGVLGWQVDWGPNHNGTQCRVSVVQLVPLGGVTYLGKAKQVTEMSSAGYYIDLKLYFVTVSSFVSMPPHHILLHTILRSFIWTIFSTDQFTHILTLSI